MIVSIYQTLEMLYLASGNTMGDVGRVPRSEAMEGRAALQYGTLPFLTIYSMHVGNNEPVVIFATSWFGCPVPFDFAFRFSGQGQGPAGLKGLVCLAIDC